MTNDQPYGTTRATALDLDARDPLASFRSRFHIPKRADGSETIYLCGNSLGLQPRSTRQYLDEVMKDWEVLGVEGHFRAVHPWIAYHELLAGPTAELVGALPSEVVVMNTLTVNLHLMMVSFYRPTSERNKIVIEANAFPSDRYAVVSQIRYHGFNPDDVLVELTPRTGETTLRTDDIEAFLAREGDSVALVLPGGVNYYTGQAFEIGRITRAAHAKGCTVGFDLAHAAGNILLQLHDWDVDFAVWCSYKYLNAGPGSLAGCFVHERHSRDSSLPRFTGWWGQEKATRFLMGPEFTPIHGADGWQLSNPPILSMAAVRASMEIFHDAGMERLREKSVLLTGYLEFLLDQCVRDRVRSITPRDALHRGCQLSLVVDGRGKNIYKALTDRGIICDWREPDVIRIAPVPLYNSFIDVYTFVTVLKEILE